MDEAFLFRKSLLLIGVLTWARFVTWPLAWIAMFGLIYLKFKMKKEFFSLTLFTWWSMVVIGLLIIFSLIAAYFTLPENDREYRTVLYVTVLTALPILIPCLIGIFFKPKF